MSKLVHGVLQALGLVAQYGNLASGYVPPKYQPVVAAVIGLAQAVLAITNHGATK
jgi:hypothetical protein